MDLVIFEPFEDKKKTLLTLQWLIVLASSYLLLFKKGEAVEDPWAFSLIILFLLSILALNRLSRSAFDHRLFAPTLVVVDTILISAAIRLNRDSPWDLFLIFFFGLFIAATGENLVKIVAGCLLISIMAVVINPFSGMNSSLLDPDFLFRIPFLFGVSILYGYLAEQARREKARAQKAEETERLKRQLVSALAHDIKNPLGIIMGYAETVTSRLREQANGEENLEALQRVQDNAQRIVKLVTGFLDASRVEAGKLEVVQHPVQLNLLIREVGQQQMGDLRQKNLSLSVDLDDNLPEIVGDEAQFDRVLWNLLGNAVKFTPVGGKITMTSRLESDHVCISVKNTGMGIPQDELPLLFSEFRRLKGTGKVDGTGLGLFIVKTIVEAHGGTVNVESKEGEGTTFSIRLPIRP